MWLSLCLSLCTSQEIRTDLDILFCPRKASNQLLSYGSYTWNCNHLILYSFLMLCWFLSVTALFEGTGRLQIIPFCWFGGLALVLGNITIVEVTILRWQPTQFVPNFLGPSFLFCAWMCECIFSGTIQSPLTVTLIILQGNCACLGVGGIQNEVMPAREGVSPSSSGNCS